MSQFRFAALIVLIPILTIAAVNNLASVSRDDLWHYLTLGLVSAAFAILALLALIREIRRRRSSAAPG